MNLAEISNEDLAILHGCIINEIESLKKMQKDTKYGGMIAHMYTYLGKLERIQRKLEKEMKP